MTPTTSFAGMYERQGISRVLQAEEIRLDGNRRGGLSGWIDSLQEPGRGRLAHGMPEREAALARGFVLGQDDSIPESTKDDFQASGLAHLLAVSGQNVVLLGLLAIPFMALAGFGPRTRLVCVAALILLYVPLTGAGASIQRAGVMGLAGLVALAATRPASRLYALVLAAAVTLALNPRAGSDIGWQLSFAAVIGIYLLTGPLQVRLAGLIGHGGWRTGLVDGLAVTVAATLATAPLMAFHFESFPGDDARGEPARSAGGRTGNVARHGLGGGRSGQRRAGTAVQPAERAAAGLHRPGRGMVRRLRRGPRSRSRSAARSGWC